MRLREQSWRDCNFSGVVEVDREVESLSQFDHQIELSIALKIGGAAEVKIFVYALELVSAVCDRDVAIAQGGFVDVQLLISGLSFTIKWSHEARIFSIITRYSVDATQISGEKFFELMNSALQYSFCNISAESTLIRSSVVSILDALQERVDLFLSRLARQT